MISILFFTRVDRTYFIQKILEYIYLKHRDCKLVVISDNQWNSCRKFVENFEYIPSNTDICSFIKKVIKKYNVKGIFVASNYDLIYLINMKLWLKSNRIRYYAPDQKTLRICLSKMELNCFLKENDFLAPLTFTLEDVLKHGEEMFPLIVKPVDGQGSKNVIEVSNIDDLIWYCKKDSTLLIQTKIEGKEYTVDCFNDYDGELLICVPRERLIVNNGHAIAVQIKMNQELIKMASIISQKLKIIGPWNFQAFEVEGQFIIHDINPRMANGLIYSIEAGVPFDMLIVDYLLYENSGFHKNYPVEDERIVYQYSVCGM